MTPQQLKASILKYAMQGKLVEQKPEDGTGEDLFCKIQQVSKPNKNVTPIVEEEIPFDIPSSWKSLYIANFLGENEAQAQQIFKQVRKIYSSRSSAVHGNKTKDNLESAVEESANLLTRILRRCAELNKLPDVDNLAFRVDKQKQGIKCKILVP